MSRNSTEIIESAKLTVNLVDVIEVLVDEKGLDRKEVISIVCDGVHAAYSKKYPDLEFVVSYSHKADEAEVFVKKEIITGVASREDEISLRRAKGLDPKAVVGNVINVPFEEKIGRVEILVAKQVIASKIRELEQYALVREFKDREGTVVTGTVHKKQRGGTVIKLGEAMAFLPISLSIFGEELRVGTPVRALLSEVLEEPRGDFQLILDRGSVEFVKSLLFLEIPEIFERIVEIKKIVRSSGYKTKVVVSSNSSDVDPVGTCVGVGGSRIKPILREIGGEKIDLIQDTENIELLVKNSLKPAEIDKVEISSNGKSALIWLAKDQRSMAIGKMGRNIELSSRLTGLEINLQEETVPDEDSFNEDEA